MSAEHQPSQSHHHHPPAAGAALPPGKLRDPVCGMTVDPATARQRHEHAGQTWFFCGPKCREKFAADPARYLAPAEVPAPAPPVAAAGTTWTCPMHPEVIRSGPGACPLCGMALEPMTPTGAEGANPELADMTRRFWVAAGLALPLLLFAMAQHVAPQPLGAWLSPHAATWLQCALASPVVLWAGAPFFARGWQSLRNRNLNIRRVHRLVRHGVDG